MVSLKYYAQVNGKDLWIAGVSAIGPYTTSDPQKALRFETEQEAMNHPAWAHPICLTEIVESPQ